MKLLKVSLLILFLSLLALGQTVQPPELRKASEFLQAEKWDEATSTLEEFVAGNPENARGWYLLASALHGKGNYSGAASALQKNLAIGENWPAMYNLAAAYARLGNKALAFEWLDKSLNSGGAFAVDIEKDEDFESLHGEPDFKRLLEVVARAKNPCMYSEKARQFDFWIGDWDVYVGDTKVGENLIERDAGGCTLIENWKNTRGGTGKSINVYDGSVDKWKQFYVGSQGDVYLFEGRLEGNMMKFTAETVDSKGVKTLHKFEFTDNEDKTVRQMWATSTDNGNTFTTIWDSIYKKKDSGDRSQESVGKEVSFDSTDGVKLFGDVYKSAKGMTAPLVLLFHQGGGDVRGEYSSHISKLLSRGYNVIAVDLRTGGDRFGSENRTVAALGDKKYGYCDAYPDLEASLKFARRQGFTGKTVAWGSSFSAALVFQLASKRGDDLAGILAFSPASGGPMEPCKPDLFFSEITIPVLAARPRSEMNENSEAQFAAFRQRGIETYIAENGVHGSSMLVSDRVKGDVSDHWEVVFAFLKKAFRE